MKKLIIIISISVLTYMPNGVFADSASVVGCNYGFLDINTKPIAQNVASKLSNNMNFQLFNTYAPTYNILSGQPVSGKYFLESNVLFFAGHANNSVMTWSGCTSEKIGITKVANDTYDGEYTYVGIGQYNLNNVKFAMLEGCQTASGSNNITSKFVSYGATASLGWTTDMNTLSANAWQTNFWNKIISGGSISQANSYANSFTYVASSIKNTKMYGNTNLKLYPTITINDQSGLLNSKYIGTIVSSNIVHDLERLIRENFDNSFDLNNFSIQKSISNNTKIYDLIFNYNNIFVEVGYTIFVEDNAITYIFNNMNNYNENDLKKLISKFNTSKGQNNLDDKTIFVYNIEEDKIIIYQNELETNELGARIINTNKMLAY